MAENRKRTGRPLIECDPTVEAGDMVYLDNGVAKPARSNSKLTMPAEFYVTKKKGSSKCYVTKEWLVTVENDTTTGPNFFVSESEAGKVQTEVPTEAGHVLQKVGSRLVDEKRYYFISNNVTVRS